MSDSEDPIDNVSEGGDDLFGEDDNLGEDELASDKAASDRDEERGDRGGDDGDGAETKDKVVMSLKLYRHRIPKSKDGQLQVLRVPPFLKFQPEEFKPKTYTPSEWDVANNASPHPKPAVRWQRDASTGQMRSNTNVYRWSDGSVTMAVGGDHYEIQTKSQAPAPGKPYHELQDSMYYAAAAHLNSNVLLVVGHVAEQYSVRPNRDGEDEAVQRLTDRLLAAKQAHGEDARDIIIHATQDPELQKKQAELAEKERIRAQRRRETAAARLDGLGRGSGGGGGGRSAGLSIGDLEGGAGGAGGAGGRRGAQGQGRKRGAPGSGRARRRRPDYDSDDDLPQGQRRMEEYEKDEFVVSDEDDEEEGSGDEEEDILDDDDEEEEEEERTQKSRDRGAGNKRSASGKKQQQQPRSSKRQRTAEPEDEEEDAEADLDDEDAPAALSQAEGRSRRRQVIDDDDE